MESLLDSDVHNISSPSDAAEGEEHTPQSPTSPTTETSPGDRPKTGASNKASGPSTGEEQKPQPLPHGLNPRSCVTCRKRKVKCDKSHPCSNCSRAGIECIFPKPGRAPRRSKKGPDSELLARLRRLEGVVSKMGKNVDGEDVTTDQSSLTSSSTNDQPMIAPPMPTMPSGVSECKATDPEVYPAPVYKVTQEMGRLVVEQGKSRYVSNKFWAQLTSELVELQELLHENPSDDEDGDHGSSPGSSGRGSEKATHQEFLFGYSSLTNSLRSLHPHHRLIMTYWALFKENIDPVLRLLHKPSIELMFIQALSDLDRLPKSTEVLMFAIYLTVVTSLTPEECKAKLDLEKESALAKYRYCTEQALARAGFIETQELRVLQAAMLYVSAVRRMDGTGFVWGLTGLMMRIAQRQGLHRDGSNFNLSPFDCEERRRLWWQLATFDGRVSDDQGIDPIVFNMTFDTRIPLNVSDQDIWPGMTEAPQERERPTDMVFDLTRYEIGSTIRKLKIGMKTGASVDFRDKLIDQLRERLETKYLRFCDMSVPLEWVTVNICRLVLAKVWLMAHYPLNFANGKAAASPELRKRTFIKSIDIIRYTRLLETQHKTLKWGWMFRTYSQWHAAAFAFDELRRRTEGSEVDEAWHVMDEAFQEWQNPAAGYNKSILWKPITRLRALAQEARKKALTRQQMVYPQDGSLGPSQQSFTGSTDFRTPESWNSNTEQTSQASESATMNVMGGPRGSFPTDMTMNTEQSGAMSVSNDMLNPGMPLISDDGMFATPPGVNMENYPEQIGVNGWMQGGGPDLRATNWMDDTDMNWNDINAMISEPININMGAMWGDPAGPGELR